MTAIGIFWLYQCNVIGKPCHCRKQGKDCRGYLIARRGK
jgi:hypothetical protein